MISVIISGGIGSGKSTVCRILEEDFGWPVYCADQRVKDLYFTHSGLLSQIETALADTFRDDCGRFIPHLLASRIFKDQDALNLVENLVFPVLTDDFFKWKSEHADNEYVILESATILEKEELIGLGDYIVVVDAALETRIVRAEERDGVSRDAIIARVKNQTMMNAVSSGVVPSFVDYVISNDGSIDELKVKIRKFVDHICETKML